jgi:hypothetical protein
MAEFFLILGVIVIYFAPLLVAAWVRHPKLAYIGGLNAALGVTIVGWAGALVWALRRRRVVAMSYHGDMEVPRSFNTGLFAVAGLVVAVAIIATMGVNRLQDRRTAQAASALYVSDALVVPQWHHAVVDGVDMASLTSRNSLTQPAPYKGGPVTLSVMRGADGAVVRLDADAEMACSFAPTASSVQISFDSGPDQTFACAPAPAGARKLLFDGDHSTAYLADPVAFLARLKGVRHIAITAAFTGVNEPPPLQYDLPPEAPLAPTEASAAKPASAVAAPAAALATAAVVPVAAGATDDPASDETPRGRHHHHARHFRHDEATYVDGIPTHGHHRHHHRRA